MSFNQSRSDKNETQYRKTGRSASFNQQRGPLGAYSKGSGGSGAGGPTPSPSITSNRSFKKSNNNSQGGQPRANASSVNSSDSSTAPTHRGVQNGAHTQPQFREAFDAPTSSTASKQTEHTATHKSSRAVPKAPASLSTSMSYDSPATTTPTKAPTDESKQQFPLQFGSLSPSFMPVMQIPARTSSAPPNLDEQKSDQARYGALRSVPPSLPTPPAPRQQLPKKEADAVDQSNSAETHATPKAKKDVQVQPSITTSQTQKPSCHPMTSISMAMPFHQPQVSVQVGGPNHQMQSQGVLATSLQMPVHMPLAMGSAAQVQQSMFMPGLQPHPMQAIHQGHNLGYTTQMGHQLSPQLVNLGISIGPQYPQQQAAKFSGPRKTTSVKITHPKTHEELRLDKRTDAYADGGSLGPRPHSVLSQSPPVQSFAHSHPINYYPSPLYYPSSLPLTSCQMPPNSQAPRFNYSVKQGPQNVTFMNPSAVSSLPASKAGSHTPGVSEPPSFEHAREVHNTVSSVPSVMSVSVKPAAVSIGEKTANLLLNSSAASDISESLKPSRDSEIFVDGSVEQSKSGSYLLAPNSTVNNNLSEVIPAAVSVGSQLSSSMPSTLDAPVEESVQVVNQAEHRRKENLSNSNSFKEQHKRAGKKGTQSQHQVSEQSTSPTRLTSQAMKNGLPLGSGVSETLGSNKPLVSLVSGENVPQSTKESLSTFRATTIDGSAAKGYGIQDRPACILSEVSDANSAVNTLDSICYGKLDSSWQDELVKHDSTRTEKHGKNLVSQGPSQTANNFEISSEHNSFKCEEFVPKIGLESVQEQTARSNAVKLQAAQEVSKSKSSCAEEGGKLNSFESSTLMNLESKDVLAFHGGHLSRTDSTSSSEATSLKSGRVDQQPDSAQDAASKHVREIVENSGCAETVDGGTGVSDPMSGSKDKPAPELNRSKSTTARAKKKMKEILQKADAAGTTSDLYMAYKGPEEKKETAVATETNENTSTSMSSMQEPNSTEDDAVVTEKDTHVKTELDDWEDAADISKPKLETSDSVEQVSGGIVHQEKDGNGTMDKKYSRDFLLKFAKQCTELPEGFDSDISDILMNDAMSASHVIDRDSYSSPGRNTDKSSGPPRLDRRGSGMTDDDKWSKLPSPFGSGHEMRPDVGFGGNPGFRPGQGGNYGVLRNPRAQAPVQYVGGILYGPMQSIGSQAAMQRNSPDADRWQRATNFQQRGLIPSPQTPLQVMHKAERKYEVGKVTNEEQAKQRLLKGILNKLTPQNFEILFEQVKAVYIDNAVTLTGVISQIFDKALMEPTFCEMYANFCYHLAGELPEINEDNEKITFKRLLLNKCQEEFERGEREEEEANEASEGGQVKQSEDEREEKRLKARRRMLGNIRLIGELFKKRMLTEKIMHECIKKLFGQCQTPDEEDVEALCKLMSTIGEMIDHPKAKAYMDVYFDRMQDLSNNMNLSCRVRFMLKDAIDLRKNKWQQRRKVEGPKKIDEVHRDAAQERHAQSSRLGRGPGINPSARRGPPMDFSPRGSSILSSLNSQMGSFRGMPPQARGFGIQDVRFEERQFEARTLSVPLTQRAVGKDSITLGPQGGLARGMSFRGPSSMSAAPLPDVPSTTVDSRRMAGGSNGCGSLSDRVTYGPREDLVLRCMSDRFAAPTAYEPSSLQDRSPNYGSCDPRNADQSLDRSISSSPPMLGQGSVSSQNVPLEKALPEERLRDMSMATIKEFYSARDEKEVAMCIKDMNSSSFHPTMISLWVTHSFEKKDVERDLLAKLLVNLTKSDGTTLSQAELIKGFESILATLEDTVNDAPKAPEFLGRLFAMVIIENIISLGEIAQLILQGGEEPGMLQEAGLAADVLGHMLESIKSEKGESGVSEIRTRSNLHLESFRPPDPLRSNILEKFI